MNKKDIANSNVIDIIICENCGMKKYTIPTLDFTGASMLRKLKLTSHCCDHPTYWWSHISGLYKRIQS